MEEVNPAVRNGLLVIVSTLVSYVLFEAGLYLALCFGLALPIHPYYNYNAWTNPHYIVADAVIGMRFRPDQPNDGLSVIRGDVQYYYKNTTANSAGFHSDHEYLLKKQKAYRVVVYGSSFVAMIYQNGSWVDHLHHVIGNSDIEVYNFSFDGAGVANWHEHYFRELAAKYDFDMVVFAMTADDMLGSFLVAETRPDGYFLKTFSEPPRDIEDLDRNYRPNLWPVLGMADRGFLEKLNSHFTHHSFLALPFNLYALKSIRLLIFGDESRPNWASANFAIPDKGKLRALFASMLHDIRARGKKALVVALPWDHHRIFQVPNSDAEQLRAVAEENCGGFVDGNELFRRSLTAEQIEDYWPRYEVHWLKRGGDRFAELLAPEIIHERESEIRSSKVCP